MHNRLTPILLNTLLSSWVELEPSNILISGLTLDSRKIVKDNLFVALQGSTLDGRVFIDKAIMLGASAILCETKVATEHGSVCYKNSVPVISIYELPLIISQLAYQFYFPNQDLHKVIAVTGTNGKTTIASLLANCFSLLGKSSAQMGTIGNGLFGHLQSSLNTTLDAISVFAELYTYQQQQVEYTIMEVSSHGLSQGRVTAIPFYSAIFTNLTRDHLDYHGTMDAYRAAKKRLFQEYAVTHRIINAEDNTGLEWLNDFPDGIGYGIKDQSFANNNLFLQVTRIKYLAQGIHFEFSSPWGNGNISAPFYGDFNVSNLSAVASQLLAENISVKEIEHIFPKLTCVPGRMEQYAFSQQQVTFVVDYAHTPDALEKALIALQKHKSSGRLICLFGCGGDRDKGKRPEMAKVAELFSDQVILIDDNPRSEAPNDIMDDILAGFSDPSVVLAIHERKEAVLFSLENSLPGDIVLLAGKGHEDYQIIGNKRIHYSDRELLASLQDKYNNVNNEVDA